MKHLAYLGRGLFESIGPELKSPDGVLGFDVESDPMKDGVFRERAYRRLLALLRSKLEIDCVQHSASLPVPKYFSPERLERIGFCYGEHVDLGRSR